MATMRYKNDRDQWVVLSFGGGSGGDITSDVIADSYNSERTEENPYNTGAIVMHEGIMYKAKEDGIYGEFDESKWRQINVDIAIREAGGSGRAEWGYISGDIEDQEDLVEEFEKKQDKLTAGEGITIQDNVISAESYIPPLPEFNPNKQYVLSTAPNREGTGYVIVWVEYIPGGGGSSPIVGTGIVGSMIIR